MFKMKNALLISCSIVAAFHLLGCISKPEQKVARKENDYIRQIPGIDESIPAEVIERGEVLISYSDCYTCHKQDQRSVGPAFKDIAKRYPVNEVYIEMLANKIIIGGSRSWGYPIMVPHPNLSLEDAKTMVSYILSIKK
jgi:cytochrome c